MLLRLLFTVLCLTDMNIYPMNNKTDHLFLEKYIFNIFFFFFLSWYFFRIRSRIRIRIHIKMKRILNTGYLGCFEPMPFLQAEL